MRGWRSGIEPGRDQSDRPSGGLGAATTRRRARPERIELAASVTIMAISSVHLVAYLRIFARESLWNDELFSVIRTSGEGPVHTVTTYESANNHVFFNLLNALTPGAGSVDPLRARLWSVVAVLAMLVVLVLEFYRRGWYLGGAVLFTLFAANPAWLDLTLQARGYGLLGLAAAVSCVATWRYLESPSSSALAVLAVATSLGTWTVPSFVLFAAPAWIVLLAISRRRQVFAFALGSAATTLALHLPILGQLRDEQSGYAEQWGRSYTTLSDVAATLRVWLLNPGLTLDRSFGTRPVLLAVFVVIPVVGSLPTVPPAVRRLVWLLMGSVGAFFAANLHLGTAAPRTTAFVVVPVAVSACVLGATLQRRWLPLDGPRTGQPVLGSLGVTAVAVVLVVYAGHRVQGTRDHLPMEDWRTAAAYVERTYGEEVAVASHPAAGPDVRAAYLDRRRPHVPPRDQAGPLSDGTAILYDRGTVEPPVHDFGRYASVFAEVRVPQIRGSYLRILSAPPLESNVDAIEIDGAAQPMATVLDRRVGHGLPIVDGIGAPGATIRIDPTAGTVARSVIIVGDPTMPRVERVDLVLADDGATMTVEPEKVTGSDTTITVALGDRRIDHVDITLVPVADGGRPPTLQEVWINTGP